MKLDQFLKWKNLVSSGGEAKIFIKSGSVKVNGVIETRRGRKLNKGDKVIFLGDIPQEPDLEKDAAVTDAQLSKDTKSAEI